MRWRTVKWIPEWLLSISQRSLLIVGSGDGRCTLLVQQRSATAQQRVPDQRRNHRNHSQHQLCSLSVCVLAYNRVLDTEVELDWHFAEQRSLRDHQAHRHVPPVAGCSPGVIGNRRVEAELPGVRQVDGEKVEEVQIAGIANAWRTVARRADPEVVLPEHPEGRCLCPVAHHQGRTETPLLATKGIVGRGWEQEGRSCAEEPVP